MKLIGVNPPSTAFALLALGIALSCGQSVPSLVNYQGRLTDAAGRPLPPGNYSVAFRLWDKQALDASQQLIWGREYDVTVVAGGAFNIILGTSGRALTDSPTAAVNDLAYGFNESSRFLGLTVTRDGSGQVVANPSELMPRQQILSSPYSVTAQNLARESLRAISVDPAFLRDILQPPGTIVAFGGANTPAGWLLCDGREVSRSGETERLYQAIGTAWGNGNASTTFNVPDLRGLFLRGVNYSPVTGTNVYDPESSMRRMLRTGGNIGNQVGSLQDDAFQTHNHKVYASQQQAAVANDSRRVPDNTDNVIRTDQFTRTNAPTDLFAAEELQPARAAVETRPKNVYVNYIIKY